MSAKGNSNSGHKVLVRIVPVGFDEAFRKITSSLNEINKSIAKSDKSLLSSVKNMERLVKQMERVQSKSERFAKDTASAMKEISNAHKTGRKIGEEFAKEYKKAVKEESKKQRDLGTAANDFNRVLNKGFSGLLLEFGRTVGKSGSGQSTDGGTLGKVMRSGFVQQAAKLAVIGGALGIIGHGVGKIVDSLAHISPHIQALLKIMDVMATMVFLPFGQFIFSVFKPIMLLMLRYLILPFAKFMGLQVGNLDKFNKAIDKAITGSENVPVMEIAEAVTMGVIAALALFFIGGNFAKGLSGALSGAINKFTGGTGGSGIFGKGAGIFSQSGKNCIDLCRNTMDGISRSVKEGTKEGLKEGLKDGVKIGAPLAAGGAVAVALYGQKEAVADTGGNASTNGNKTLEDIKEDVQEFQKDHQNTMEENSNRIKDTQRDVDRFTEEWDRIWNSTTSTIDRNGQSLKDLFDKSTKLTSEEQKKLEETIKTKYQELFGSVSNTSKSLIDQSKVIIDLTEVGNKNIGRQWEDLGIEINKIGLKTAGSVGYYMTEFTDYVGERFQNNKEVLGTAAAVATATMAGNYVEAEKLFAELSAKAKGVGAMMPPIWGMIIDAAQQAGFKGQEAWTEVQYQLQIVGGESKKTADIATEVNENTAFSWIGFGEDIRASIDRATPKVDQTIQEIGGFTAYINELLKGVQTPATGSTSGGAGSTSGGSTSGGSSGGGTITHHEREQEILDLARRAGVRVTSDSYVNAAGNIVTPSGNLSLGQQSSAYSSGGGLSLMQLKERFGDIGYVKVGSNWMPKVLRNAQIELQDAQEDLGMYQRRASASAKKLSNNIRAAKNQYEYYKNRDPQLAAARLEELQRLEAEYQERLNPPIIAETRTRIERADRAYSDLKNIFGMARGGIINEPILGIGQWTGRKFAFGEMGKKEFVFNQDQIAGRSTPPVPLGNGGGINVTVPIQVFTQKDIDSEKIAFIVKKAIKDEIDRYQRV